MQNEEYQDGDLENTEVETTEETTVETVEEDTTDWKAEALKYKAIADRQKKKSNPTIIKQEDQKPIRPSDILRADEFKLHRMGYNEDELDLIMKNGGMAVIKDEKNPLALGLKVAREQRLAEEAASKAQDTSGMSELEKKYTKADLDKMSVSELEKILPHAN